MCVAYIFVWYEFLFLLHFEYYRYGVGIFLYFDDVGPHFPYLKHIFAVDHIALLLKSVTHMMQWFPVKYISSYNYWCSVLFMSTRTWFCNQQNCNIINSSAPGQYDHHFGKPHFHLHFYASAFRRRRHYVFGLSFCRSVCPKPEIPSFDMYMGPLVHPTNRDCFRACPLVCPSVCLLPRYDHSHSRWSFPLCGWPLKQKRPLEDTAPNMLKWSFEWF